jgi:hypothetical protein
MVIGIISSICFKFPYTDKSKILGLFKSEEIKFWGWYTILIPFEEKAFIYGIGNTNNLAIMDKIEEELLGSELEFEEFVKAAKQVGTKYSMFHPSVDISDYY